MNLFERIEFAGTRAANRLSASRHPRRCYYLGYTGLFCVFMGIIAAGYIFAGKSFIWGTDGDGMRQHYTSLAYFGGYLRQILENIFVAHTFEIPMWDMHIGYGSDILTTLHYYTIGDPLNLLSVFVPERYTEYLYNFLMVVRVYLSGIAFSAYCRYHGNKALPTLLGAVMYVFSGWIMVAGFRHPLFINPCIYFPLVLLGIDKIFKKENPCLFMIMVGISAISNFYFFYMIAIFMIIYAVYRYFMIFRKFRTKEVLRWLGKFAGYGLGGLMMSCVIFLPTIMALLGTDRMSAGIEIPGVYQMKHYRMLLPALTGQYLSKYTIIGVSVMALLGLFVMFVQRKKYTAEKIGFVMCMIFLCVPYIAHIINGFSYATNRWCWVMTMLLSYIFVKVCPDIFTLRKGQRIAVGVCAALYCLYIYKDRLARGKWNVISAGIFLGVCIVLLAAFHYLEKHKTWQGILLFFGLGSSLAVNIYFSYTSAGNQLSRVSSFVDAGEAYNIVHEPVQAAVAELPDSSRYRYEQMGSGVQYNSSILTGLSGGQFFYSLGNGYVSQFRDESYSNMPLEQRIENLNNRAFLMKLFSMKYFAGHDGEVPYGFRKIQEVEGRNSSKGGKPVGIYEDENALPLAYTYDRCIPMEKYQEMNVMERQQAMLQGVVMDQSGLEECVPEDTSVKVEYEITELDNVEVLDNRIKTKADNASCVLKIHGLPRCETNVVFKGLDYLEVNRRHKYTDEAWNALSLGEKYDIFVKDQDIDYRAYIRLETEADGRQAGNTVSLLTKKNNFYGGRHDFAGNLGYHEEGIASVKITFSEKGSYRYEELGVYCQPMDRLEAYCGERKADRVEDISIQGNEASCRVKLYEPKALVFSLPYSKGWTAKVNGRETELKQANTMFMAVELEAGENEVRLFYTTPYIKTGLLLSVLGAAVTLLCFRVFRKSKH